jgi:NADH-quinone oxidoreductase subunit H
VVPAEEPFPVRGVLPLLHRRDRRGQPHPLRPPEAESELVSGYNIEYSGCASCSSSSPSGQPLDDERHRDARLPRAGRSPGDAAEIAASTGLGFAGWQLLSFLVFAVKASALVFLVVQLRWTLPRLRVDQLMIVCWKYLVPLAFACVAGVLVLLPLVAEGGLVDLVFRAVLTLLTLTVLVHYVRRIRQNYLVDREAYARMTGRPLFFPPYRLP